MGYLSGGLDSGVPAAAVDLEQILETQRIGEEELREEDLLLPICPIEMNRLYYVLCDSQWSISEFYSISFKLHTF